MKLWKVTSLQYNICAPYTNHGSICLKPSGVQKFSETQPLPDLFESATCLSTCHLFFSIHITDSLSDWLGQFMSIYPFGCLSVFNCISGTGHNALRWTDSIIVIGRGIDCRVPAQWLFVCWCSIYWIREPSYTSEQHTGNKDTSEIMWHKMKTQEQKTYVWCH